MKTRLVFEAIGRALQRAQGENRGRNPKSNQGKRDDHGCLAIDTATA
jgi:hypothetical protein